MIRRGQRDCGQQGDSAEGLQAPFPSSGIVVDLKQLGTRAYDNPSTQGVVEKWENLGLRDTPDNLAQTYSVQPNDLMVVSTSQGYGGN